MIDRFPDPSDLDGSLLTTDPQVLMKQDLGFFRLSVLIDSVEETDRAMNDISRS